MHPLGVDSIHHDKLSIAVCLNELVGALRPLVDCVLLACRGGYHQSVITKGAPQCIAS